MPNTERRTSNIQQRALAGSKPGTWSLKLAAPGRVLAANGGSPMSGMLRFGWLALAAAVAMLAAGCGPV